MSNPIEEHRAQIEELCRRYRVRRLDVFGSVLTDDFDPKRSDLDLLVEFEPDEPVDLATYFELRDALTETIGIPVDLVMAGAVKNPIIKADIEATRELVYAA
jgi:uncharacterized protein